MFATKGRERTLDESRRAELFKYIWGIIKNLDSEHHRTQSFVDEYRVFLRKAGLELDERYLP